MSSIDTSIILVNYKTPQLLEDCISSIYEKTFNLSFEIIVVDNNSNDGSERTIEDKFLQSGENLGFGKANNIGIKIAQGDKILFLNSDTLLINNAIKILSEFLNNNDKVCVCGGNLFDLEKKHVHSFNRSFPGVFVELDSIVNFKLSSLLKKKTEGFNTSDRPIKVAYICGADMMVRRKVLEEVGGFDPDFFLYFEETELSFRISKKDYDIINVPEAEIIHLEGASHNSILKKLQYFNSSRKIYYRKRYNYICFVAVCLLFLLKCYLGWLKSCFIRNDQRKQFWEMNIKTF